MITLSQATFQMMSLHWSRVLIKRCMGRREVTDTINKTASSLDADEPDP